MAENSRKAGSKGKRPGEPGAGKPFEKGTSGNPGGRPKLLPEFKRALEQKHYPRALEVLRDCLDDEDGRVRIVAVREVFDRLFGKPKQPITGDADEPIAVNVDIATMLARLAGDDG